MSQPAFVLPLEFFKPEQGAMPDESENCIVIYELDGARTWTTAWWDAVLLNWVLCESGGFLDGEVKCFARVDPSKLDHV